MQLLNSRLGHQPVSGPAHQVGGEDGKILLQKQRGLRTHFEMMPLEDVVTFFDASLNRLSVLGQKRSCGLAHGSSFNARCHRYTRQGSVVKVHFFSRFWQFGYQLHKS